MQNSFKIHVNWSTAANTFIADVPELSGCIADGRTFDEALDNVQLVIEEWIHTAKIFGHPSYQLPVESFHA